MAEHISNEDGIQSAVPLLPAAASNGYFTLIREFGLANYSAEMFRKEAFLSAIKNGHDLVAKHLIDTFKVETDFIKLVSLARFVIQSKNREMLKYLLEKRFGPSIKAKVKARILLCLVATLRFHFTDTKDTIKVQIIDFCRMMGWTRFQINLKAFSQSSIQITLKCILGKSQNGWRWSPELDSIMEECLESLPPC